MANRYETAKGNEEEWYQIKCHKCGFIDATTDKSKWTCSQCEMKAGSPELKKALDTLTEKKPVCVSQQALNETKTVQHATEHEIEKSGFMDAFHKVLGTKLAEPATVKSEFKVGGLQCKIVSTRKN